MLPEALFRFSFEGSPIGQVLLAPTEKLQFLAVNDAFLATASRTRSEVLGRPLFEVFPADPADPQGQGAQALARSIARAIETGKSQVMPAQRYPIEMERDGKRWFEDMYWSATNTPIYDADGQLLCISHTTMDITERVRSDMRLRESEERSRAYIMATSDVVYRMSPDWAYMHELDGRGFLKTTAEWAAYRIEDYVHPADLERAREAIATAIRDKAVFELEHRVVRSDGSPGWTYSRAVPRLDGDGEIYEWIGAASDITERKLAEEKLKDADRRKDEFLAMLAHELRNPLAPIGSAAEVLQRSVNHDERIRRTSEIISRQVRHMKGLVDDLLDVSRVTRGHVTLDTEPVEIRQVVSEAIEQVSPLLQSRGHRLTVQLTPQATVVSGDRKRLVQVLANLLNNAVKYTPDAGAICLATEARDAHVLVEVSDNGIGMPADLTPKVFDLFTQAERPSDRSAGGLGLGLALVKSLVELHQGVVTCESPGIDRGSKFTVRLPRLVDDVRPDRTGPPAGTPQATVSRRIMIIDDNADAASVLAMLLETLGHEVFVEHSSRGALALSKDRRPDVCVLDIGLPDMDGYQLARRLREQPETASAQLIAVTGYGQDSDRLAAIAAGFDEHFVKPVDAMKLVAAMGLMEGPVGPPGSPDPCPPAGAA